MSDLAQRCDGCSRMTYDVERVALFVAAKITVERDLCILCREVTLDGFIAARAEIPDKRAPLTFTVTTTAADDVLITAVEA